MTLFFWVKALLLTLCPLSAGAQALPAQWLNISPLSAQGASAAAQQADIAAHGASAAAAWSGEAFGVQTLFWRESHDRGETWEPATLLFPPDAERVEPSLAHDGAALWIAWTQRGADGGTDIWDSAPNAKRLVDADARLRGRLRLPSPACCHALKSAARRACL